MFKKCNLFFYLLTFSLASFPRMVSADLLPPNASSKDAFYVFALFYIVGPLLIVISNLIINGFILSVLYSVLKYGRKMIVSWRFVGYITLVTIGGFVIDFVYVVGATMFSSVLIHFISGGLTSILLALYNYWLPRKMFSISQKHAVIVGIVMGILTSPWLGILLKKIL